MIQRFLPSRIALWRLCFDVILANVAGWLLWLDIFSLRDLIQHAVAARIFGV